MVKVQHKQALKRRVARVWAHLDEAATQLALIYPDFDATHKDLAELIEAMAKQTLIVQEELEDFWRMSWGELPQDIKSWQ